MDKEQFLKLIKQIESSNGKDTDHTPMSSGMHKGEAAIGSYGLMPNTVNEIVTRSKDRGLASIKDMSPSEKKSFIESNPDIEEKLAGNLAEHVLNKQKDPEKAAYSWLMGHNLSPDAIEKRKYKDSDYVKKFNKLNTSMERKPAMANDNKPFYKPSPEEEEKLKKYIQEGPPVSKLDNIKGLSDESMKQGIDDLLGYKKFEDTGREGSPSDRLASIGGAPLRKAISEAQEGNFNFQGLKNVLGQFGKDPKTAPSSVDIAERTGIENPYIKTALATATDLGSDLVTPSMGTGVTGSISKVGGALAKEAQAAAPQFNKLREMFKETTPRYKEIAPPINKMYDDLSSSIRNAIPGADAKKYITATPKMLDSYVKTGTLSEDMANQIRKYHLDKNNAQNKMSNLPTEDVVEKVSEQIQEPSSKLYKVGGYEFPAEHFANMTKVVDALVKTGKISKEEAGRVIEVAPNFRKK